MFTIKKSVDLKKVPYIHFLYLINNYPSKVLSMSSVWQESTWLDLVRKLLSTTWHQKVRRDLSAKCFHSEWIPVNVIILSKFSWMACNNGGNQLMSACWGFDVINQPVIFLFVTIFITEKSVNTPICWKYYSASILFTYGIRYKTMLILAGVPTDAPKNISWRFQTPDVVEIVYDPPPEHARNGQVTFLNTNCFNKTI